MSTCQNIQYDVTLCDSAIQFTTLCFDLVNLTLDILIQYVISGSRVNNLEKSVLSDPSNLQKLTSCLCASDSKEMIQFLKCYDRKCATDRNIVLFGVTGSLWSGFCALKA
jgi:hypothetical protein